MAGMPVTPNPPPQTSDTSPFPRERHESGEIGNAPDPSLRGRRCMASRGASPNRLNPNTVSAIAKPATRGWSTRILRRRRGTSDPRPASAPARRGRDRRAGPRRGSPGRQTRSARRRGDVFYSSVIQFARRARQPAKGRRGCPFPLRRFGVRRAKPRSVVGSDQLTRKIGGNFNGG
jgi:hypothetical protein